MNELPEHVTERQRRPEASGRHWNDPLLVLDARMERHHAQEIARVLREFELRRLRRAWLLRAAAVALPFLIVLLIWLLSF